MNGNRMPTQYNAPSQAYNSQQNVNSSFPNSFSMERNQHFVNRYEGNTHHSRMPNTADFHRQIPPQFSSNITSTYMPPTTQFAAPPCTNAYPINQHRPASSPQNSGQQPFPHMNRNTSSESNQYAQQNLMFTTNNNMSMGTQCVSSNWTTVSNNPIFTNTALSPYIVNTPPPYIPQDTINTPISTTPPIFPANVPRLENTSTYMQHIGTAQNFAQTVSLQPVYNMYQQQSSSVMMGVNPLQPISQNSFPVVSNSTVPMPPPPINNVYPVVPVSYQLPMLTQADALHSQTSVVKHETIMKKKINPDEDLVRDFLSKAKLVKAITKGDKVPCMTIPQFRSLLKTSLSLLTQLAASKNDLKDSIALDEGAWSEKLNYIRKLQGQFSTVHRKLSNEKNVSAILAKLKKLTEKREKNYLRKERFDCHRKKKQQNRLMLHQKIDLWLDAFQEKNLQQEREAEMKKEADSILSEVRRKIQEAKRTIEKLKIFLKLRQGRKEHALKRGIFVHSKSDVAFEKKVSEMKEVMLKQLSDYEAEEKALKVMLETEQEGQLEAEAEWKLKQLRKHQEKKCNTILECLFGHSEPPLPNDPLYFFWQHYNAGNCDINSLLKIRHDWDMYLVPRDCKEGTSLPQHWIVPEAPTSSVWSSALETNSR